MCGAIPVLPKVTRLSGVDCISEKAGRPARNGTVVKYVVVYYDYVRSKMVGEMRQLTAEQVDEEAQLHYKVVYDCMMETTEYIKRELSREVSMLGISIEQDQFIFEVNTVEFAY